MNVNELGFPTRFLRARPMPRPTAASRMLLAGLVLSLLPTTGCFTVMRQAISEVRGAKADVLVISGGAEGAAHTHLVRLESTTTTVGPPIVPAGLVGSYTHRAEELFATLADVQPESGPTLSVASDVLYFSERGLLGTALALTRVRMRQESQLLADVLVRAESSSFREGDEKAVAEASVKALIKYLRGKDDGAKRDGTKPSPAP